MVAPTACLGKLSVLVLFGLPSSVKFLLSGLSKNFGGPSRTRFNGGFAVLLCLRQNRPAPPALMISSHAHSVSRKTFGSRPV
jgi:hypothetical protein